MFLATPSMHGIAAITGNMHRSLRYFVLLERITSWSQFEIWVMAKFKEVNACPPPEATLKRKH